MDVTQDLDWPVYGGLNITELGTLGLRPCDVLDFSASINPLGPSQLAVRAAREVILSSYPDTECVNLREAIGDRLGVDSSQIMVGNGSTELIYLLARSFLSEQSVAVIFAPTFGEYEAACRLQGVTPIAISPSDGFHWDVQAAIEQMAIVRPTVVFLCNPNNPTGVYLGEQEVRLVRDYLQDAARSLCIEYVPTTVNFLMMRVGDATGLRLKLLTEYRICVRDCASFGLPEYIRIGIRRMDDNRKLVEAPKQVLRS